MGRIMPHRLTLLTVVLSLTLAGTAWAQNELFPNTKDQGRAVVEYEDDAIQLVAAYNYSQLNHDSRWLLIEAAVSTEERMTVPREAFRLITPGGVEITLAAQRRFSSDIQRTRLLVQNASTTRHGVTLYFNQRTQSENFQFFRLPNEPTVRRQFVIDDRRVAFGDLFFESPTGLWDAGTYTLVLEHEGVRAAMPIELE
jgi:hypothetical protein